MISSIWLYAAVSAGTVFGFFLGAAFGRMREQEEQYERLQEFLNPKRTKQDE